MNIKSFKINELNTLSRILLTKSEAIGLCKKSNHKARKVFLRQLIGKLLEIDDVKNGVGSETVLSPTIRKLNE